MDSILSQATEAVEDYNHNIHKSVKLTRETVEAQATELQLPTAGISSTYQLSLRNKEYIKAIGWSNLRKDYPLGPMTFERSARKRDIVIAIEWVG